MLIRNAEIWGRPKADARLTDVRIAGGRIQAIGVLSPLGGEPVCDARGGLLSPGLHDHHIHLFALAASLGSVACGPPSVTAADALAAALRAATGTGWLRGVGYHESVAGDIDRRWLDAVVPDRPVRIQHRGGRLWIVNSPALALLAQDDGPPLPAGMEHHEGVPTGRLYDLDGWVRERLSGDWPDLAEASAMLAGYGVTGVTEMTPSNDDAAVAFLSSQQASARLRQSVLVAGRAGLSDHRTPGLSILATKFHLHETWLPDFDEICGGIGQSHARGRPVAIHCVTRAELVFALAALEAAGTLEGDRIEHASVAPDALIDQIASLGLGVVSQPNFIAERGQAYRQAVAPDDLPWLYRAQAFVARGTPFAGGTDAPFGRPDPWAAIRAAVARRTADGVIMGEAERLSPEAALTLFLMSGTDLRSVRTVGVGAPADLCLLDRPWVSARQSLDASHVRMTLKRGEIIHGAPD